MVGLSTGCSLVPAASGDSSGHYEEQFSFRNVPPSGLPGCLCVSFEFSVQVLSQLALGHPLYPLVVDGCAYFWGKEEELSGIMIENQTRASGK